MKIKGFNAALGPVMHIKAVCLCFDKTGKTDFDFKNIFRGRGIFIFFQSNRKMLQNHREESGSSLFPPVLSQRLALLAVSFNN